MRYPPVSSNVAGESPIYFNDFPCRGFSQLATFDDNSAPTMHRFDPPISSSNPSTRFPWQHAASSS